VVPGTLKPIKASLKMARTVNGSAHRNLDACGARPRFVVVERIDPGKDSREDCNCGRRKEQGSRPASLAEYLIKREGWGYDRPFDGYVESGRLDQPDPEGQPSQSYDHHRVPHRFPDIRGARPGLRRGCCPFHRPAE
jgi:hypothetical protein